MVSGTATFPGTKDAWDQLDRIWQVKAQLAQASVIIMSQKSKWYNFLTVNAMLPFILET